MTGNALFALAAPLAVFVLGFATAADLSVRGFSRVPMQTPVAGGDWRNMLRGELTNAAWMVGSARLGIQYYSVPEEAAKILESRSAAELLPFLAKLRVSSSSWNTEVVDVWTGIVRKGLHGRPYTITNSYALVNNRGLLLPIFSNMFFGPGRMIPTPPIFTNWIPVYTYTDNYARPIRANASAEDQDILKFVDKNLINYSENHKMLKSGDPYLVEAAGKLSNIPRPWTVPKMIRLFEQEKGERSEYLATVLAASRDPRAALALGKALDDPGYKGFGACSALFDYFVGDDSYGLPPEDRLFVWAGKTFDLTDPAARRWWAINRSQIEAEVDKMNKP